MKILIILIENIHKNNYLNENCTEKYPFRIIFVFINYFIFTFIYLINKSKENLYTT